MTGIPAILKQGRGRRIAGLALLALGQAAAAGATAIAVRYAFNAIATPGSSTPVIALLTVVLAGLAYTVSRWHERIAAEALGYDYANAVRLRVFSHIAALPTDTLARYRSGSLSLRFVGDLGAVRNWVSRGLIRLLSAAIVIPVVAMTLFLLDPRMGLIATLGFGLVLMIAVARDLGTVQRNLRRQRARLAGDAMERINHAPQLRLLGRLPREEARLIDRANAVKRAAIIRQRRTGLLRALPDLSQAIAAAAMLYLAAIYGLASGDVAAALAALALLAQPMRDLAGVWDRYAAWDTARQRCEKLLAEPTLTQGSQTAAKQSTDAGKRRNVHVRFSQVNAGCLEGLDAEAAGDRKIGITGPNAAGKSTLLALAAGFVSTDRGHILVGSVSPTDIGDRQRHDLITYIGPNAPILSGSLRRAMTLGLARRPSDERLESVAQQLGLGPALARLGGLDARVAENGRNLSRGEIRRVLMIRALLAKTPLLLLDDVDEGLDIQGRRSLASMLRKSHATVLLASHDWGVLNELDEIWFIDQGRLMECGEPHVLWTRGGPTALFFNREKTA